MGNQMPEVGHNNKPETPETDASRGFIQKLAGQIGTRIRNIICSDSWGALATAGMLTASITLVPGIVEHHKKDREDELSGKPLARFLEQEHYNNHRELSKIFKSSPAELRDIVEKAKQGHIKLSGYHRCCEFLANLELLPAKDLQEVWKNYGGISAWFYPWAKEFLPENKLPHDMK